LNAPVVTRVAEAPATPATRAKVLPPLDTPPGRMGTLEALRGALSALAANKLRAMLTALGIFIGVAAVIATVAVGAGARQQVLAQIQSLGANVIVIWGGSVNVGGVRLGAGQRQNLTWDDARAIERDIGAVEAASGNIRSQQQVVAGKPELGDPVQGSDPAVRMTGMAEAAVAFTAEEAAAGARCPCSAPRSREPVRRRRPGRPARSASAHPLRGDRRRRPQGPEPMGRTDDAVSSLLDARAQ
jgi:putative ABC transport system permease protein